MLSMLSNKLARRAFVEERAHKSLGSLETIMFLNLSNTDSYSASLTISCNSVDANLP
jgi:hypothetical protein